jgi:corrinoid protein of di/trimethylamine methyltransferase
MSEEIFRQLEQAVIKGEPEEAEELAQQALDGGLDPLACINEGLTRGMNRVGELFSSGEYFLPDLVIAGDAMKGAMAILEPALVGGQKREIAARVVLGTVEGDIHDIGKTLVGIMLTANGFDVIDIGADKSADEFVAAVREREATLVGASTLLTTTMPEQKKIIQALEEAGLRDQVMVMVGGAPVSQIWADKIGADGYAKNAMSAVDLAFRLIDAPT